MGHFPDRAFQINTQTNHDKAMQKTYGLDERKTEKRRQTNYRLTKNEK